LRRNNSLKAGKIKPLPAGKGEKCLITNPASTRTGTKYQQSALIFRTGKPPGTAGNPPLRLSGGKLIGGRNFVCPAGGGAKAGNGQVVAVSKGQAFLFEAHQKDKRIVVV
jgi:hypothetical protein